jgi:hypothetical protein
MSSSAPVMANSKATAGKQSRTPPDEKFWVRYSQHHELPLSSATSVMVHVLGIALIALGAWLAYLLGWAGPEPLPAVGVVALGGGGGDPKGAVGETDPRTQTVDKDVVDPKTADAKIEAPPLPDANLQVPENSDPVVILPTLTNPDGSRPFPANEMIKRLASIQSDARKQMFNALQDKGQGGPGTGGGAGKGAGPSAGSGVGEGGKGTMSQRQKRLLRWTMIFNTANGGDYADQLLALGALLAVPHPTEQGQFLLIKDLKTRPVKLETGNLEEIKQIFWVDDKPDSVTSLSRALGLPRAPRFVVAFFPLAFEEKLLKLELAYHNKREDQIHETQFNIERRGGTYEPRVTNQH